MRWPGIIKSVGKRCVNSNSLIFIFSEGWVFIPFRGFNFTRLIFWHFPFRNAYKILQEINRGNVLGKSSFFFSFIFSRRAAGRRRNDEEGLCSLNSFFFFLNIYIYYNFLFHMINDFLKYIIYSFSI